MITKVLADAMSFVACATATEEIDEMMRKEDVEAAWAKLLDLSGIDPEQADFPLDAKQKIMKVLGVKGLAPKPTVAVIAGFLYRDLNKDGQYNSGEELSATLLGVPTIQGTEVSAEHYLNCYWFGPLKLGKSYKVRYEPDGVEPVTLKMTPMAGLNILHIPIRLTKPLVYIIPHSHFDPEWMNTYEGYLSRELPQVRQRLDLLQSAPAHCFANDEECVTRPLLERSDPKYKEMLKQGILDGAIEPKGLIVQNELTMPCGESIIRAMTHGEFFLSALIGEPIRPEVFWSIDQYGINYQMPQILSKAGRKYFLIGEYVSGKYEKLDPSGHEMLDPSRIPYSNSNVRNQSEFWLRGLDGSRVLAHRSWYWHPFSEFGPDYTPVLSHNCVLNFQGADFCAPDANLTSTIRKLNVANGDYKYIISPSPSFFRAVEQCPDIPTYTSESFVIHWSGVYESRVKGRQRNRQIENKILASEALATVASIEGISYPKSDMDEGWYLSLINHHHDPQITPMGPGLFDEVLARYDDAEVKIDSALNSALTWLTKNITTNEQSGTPVVVFNSLAWPRFSVVEAEVPGTLSSVRVTDSSDMPVTGQIVKTSGGRTTVAFLAKGLPCLGWGTYYVSDAAGGSTSPTATASATLIENDYIRIELTNGIIQRVIEKISGATVLQADSSAGINEIFIWKDEGCISIIQPVDNDDVVDFIGNPNAVLVARSSDVSNPAVSVIENGPARGVVQVSYELDWGTFTQQVSLDAGSHVIKFTTDVDWNPIGKISDYNGRRIRVAFNSTYNNANVWCDIPFAVIPWEQSEKIHPVNSWLGIDGGSSGAAFCHLGPQSIQVVDDTVYMTLFRSIVEPKAPSCGWDTPGDQAHENGHNTYKYAVYPHQGDWKTAGTPRVAAEVNAPFFVKVMNRHSGTVPGETSYVSVAPDSLVVTAVKPSEYTDEGTIVRLYNPTDAPVNGTLTVGFAHSGAEEVNFRDEFISSLGVSSPFAISLAPYEIMTVRILAP